MKVFATYNIKGGVGKTASAVNLAYLSAKSGARTLLWDLDPQGAATFYFRIESGIRGGASKLLRGKSDPDSLIRETDFANLDLLPADFSYRNFDLELEGSKKPTKRLAKLLQPLSRSYDHLFLDCAPSISLVSEAVFVASDALLVPTIPTVLSLRTLAQLNAHLDRRKRRRPSVLPFFCMVDRRKRMHRQIAAEAAAAGETLAAAIPYSSLVEQMGWRRKPLGTYAASSLPARAYEALWHEILRSLT